MQETVSDLERVPGRFGMITDLDILRGTLLPVLRAYGVQRAAIFGSFARGEAGPDSDLDLVVEFEDGRSLFDLAGLQLDLVDLLGRDTDIATYGSLHPRLRERVLRDQVPIL